MITSGLIETLREVYYISTVCCCLFLCSFYYRSRHRNIFSARSPFLPELVLLCVNTHIEITPILTPTSLIITWNFCIPRIPSEEPLRLELSPRSKSVYDPIYYSNESFFPFPRHGRPEKSGIISKTRNSRNFPKFNSVPSLFSLQCTSVNIKLRYRDFS